RFVGPGVVANLRGGEESFSGERARLQIEECLAALPRRGRGEARAISAAGVGGGFGQRDVGADSLVDDDDAQAGGAGAGVAHHAALDLMIRCRWIRRRAGRGRGSFIEQAPLGELGVERGGGRLVDRTARRQFPRALEEGEELGRGGAERLRRALALEGGGKFGGG